MTEANELHVVIGASGGTGSAIVRELVARGKRVRGVNRRGHANVPSVVEMLKADATDPSSMREVCQGATVVYNCVNPPFAQWTQIFPAVMEATIEGAAAADAKLVFADDTWMYGKVDRPMTENSPSRPVSNKGVLRAWLAEMLLAAYSRGKVRAIIGRGGELYGPIIESVLGQNLFGAALAGKRATWIGNLDVPLTPLFIDDFARGLVTLGEHDEAIGQVWHIPTPEPITGREFVRMIFEEVGRAPKVTAYSHQFVKALGLFWPLAREGAEMVYQFERPFIIDSSKYKHSFGKGTVTPYREGIRQTIDWYRSLSESGSYEPRRSHREFFKMNSSNEEIFKSLLPTQQKEV
jgi:nucleoside-diphosphate-sugar epimerase